MKEETESGHGQRITEDELLDAVALLRLRGLQAPSDHAESERLATPIIIELDSGQIIECNDEDLTLNELVHCNMALEQDQDDSAGLQGGQGWEAKSSDDGGGNGLPPIGINTVEIEPSSSPTTASPSSSPESRPTLSPSRYPPTSSPSWHPTQIRDPWVLRGTVYYDRNANGERDSNVDDPRYGKDVEYSYGLGGVPIQLLECDPNTNKGLRDNMLEMYGEGENSYASTVSTGYDILMHPKLVGKGEKGGMYNLIDIKVNRAYYIFLSAPEGFLLTGGVCNDDVEGWECYYTDAGGLAGGRGLLRGGSSRTQLPVHRLPRGLQGSPIPQQAPPSPEVTFDPPSEEELELGIRKGRSSKCVPVDRFGMPESHLDVGIMKVGDVHFDDTNVELSLDVLDDHMNQGARSLLDTIRGRGLLGDPYTLRQEDRDAIGVVTSEVLAINLDTQLKKKDVVLDSVTPLGVSYFGSKPEMVEEEASRDSTSVNESNDATDTPPIRHTSGMDAANAKSNTRRGKLSISLLVRGHYNRNLNVDFDYIVQDSINRDTHTIRRQLTHYNSNCRDQTTKVVNLGYTLDDFVEIHSDKGVEKPTSRLNNRQQEMEVAAAAAGGEDRDAFSLACRQKKVLPEYFEASLGGMEVETSKRPGTTYVLDVGGGNPKVVVGVIIAVCFLVLCLGIYLFRRGLRWNGRQEKLMEEWEVRESRMMPQGGSTDEDDDDVADEKVRQFDRRGMQLLGSGRSSQFIFDDISPSIVNGMPSQRRGLAQAMRREVGNMTAALGFESRLLAGRENNARNDTRGSTQPSLMRSRICTQLGIDNNPSHRGQGGEDGIAVHTRGRRGPGNVGDEGGGRSRKRRAGKKQSWRKRGSGDSRRHQSFGGG